MLLEQISLNLYTLRDQLKTRQEFVDAMGKLSSIGFRSVQLSGVAPDLMPDAEFVRICADHGIRITSTHENGPKLLSDPGACVKRLQRLGVTLTAYPFPHGIDFADAAAVSRWIKDLDRAGAALRDEGITLCYHNHQTEFYRSEGRLVLSRIFEETCLAGELDTYWVQVGGGSPLAWVQRLAGQRRLPLLHLKDLRVTSTGEQQYAELGSGSLDFPPILEAAEAGGCQSFIIEQDKTYGRDPFESVAESFRFLRACVKPGAVTCSSTSSR